MQTVLKQACLPLVSINQYVYYGDLSCGSIGLDGVAVVLYKEGEIETFSSLIVFRKYFTAEILSHKLQTLLVLNIWHNIIIVIC